jgi:hypothetical protein
MPCPCCRERNSIVCAMSSQEALPLGAGKAGAGPNPSCGTAVVRTTCPSSTWPRRNRTFSDFSGSSVCEEGYTPGAEAADPDLRAHEPACPGRGGGEKGRGCRRPRLHGAQRSHARYRARALEEAAFAVSCATRSRCPTTASWEWGAEDSAQVEPWVFASAWGTSSIPTSP